MPRISASVTVNEDLTVCVSVDGQRTPSSQFADIVNNSLKTMSQLINLMARVKSWAEEPQLRDADVFIQTAVNSLESSKNHFDDNDEKSRIISFIIEQLQLLSTTKYGRHYSPEINVFAYVIHATSAAAYQVLLDQKLLCLPSVSTLKKITRRLDSNNGLDNAAYLTLRASKLTEQQRTVVLIILIILVVCIFVFACACCVLSRLTFACWRLLRCIKIPSFDICLLLRDVVCTYFITLEIK